MYRVKAVWDYLDGRKTIVGALVAAIYVVGSQIGLWAYVDNGAVIHVIDFICGVGVAHKGVKAVQDLRG